MIALYALVDRPGGPIAVCNVHLTSPHIGPTPFAADEAICDLDYAEQLTQINYWRDRESKLLSQWIAELPQIDLIMGDFGMPIESRTIGGGRECPHECILKSGFGVRIHVLG